VRCPETELIGSLFDGELDAANTASIEFHLGRCDTCRRELESLEKLRGLIAADGIRMEASSDLHDEIESLIVRFGSGQSRRSRVRSWLAPCMTGALAASLAVFALAPSSQQQFALEGELISGHVRSLEPTHLLDVETSSRHVVKPWFNGRIDFSPAVPELADLGFPLAGGRLDSLDGKTAAAIVYRRRLHVVNLFIWRSSDEGERRYHKDGFNVLEWSRSGLRYAAVSDVEGGELDQFKHAYRSRSA
jgi:anti-sigma factor RsiW